MRSDLDKPTRQPQQGCDPMRQIGSVLDRWRAGLIADLDASASIKAILRAQRACAERQSFAG
jgi:hypothetical protein